MKLIVCFLLTISLEATAGEIWLYDSNGEPIAYLFREDLTIYMWDGTPVAYYVKDSFDIYGFNGKHLGWFEDGVIRDHDGYAVGLQRGVSTNIKGITIVSFATIASDYGPKKGINKDKPYKSDKESSPAKPDYQSSFSSEPLSLFLVNGSN